MITGRERKGCGILPFDSMFSSDHMTLYVDFDVATLFGHPSIGTENAAVIYLQLDNPRLIDTYECVICKQFDNHNVEGRVSKLYETITGEWNNNDEFKFNKIDRDITRAMECTVNICHCYQYRKHPWSDQFKRATYHIQYWIKLQEIERHLRNADDTTIFTNHRQDMN
jgi:hypothetical protein